MDERPQLRIEDESLDERLTSSQFRRTLDEIADGGTLLDDDDATDMNTRGSPDEVPHDEMSPDENFHDEASDDPDTSPTDRAQNPRDEMTRFLDQAKAALDGLTSGRLTITLPHSSPADVPNTLPFPFQPFQPQLRFNRRNTYPRRQIGSVASAYQLSRRSKPFDALPPSYRFTQRPSSAPPLRLDGDGTTTPSDVLAVSRRRFHALVDDQAELKQAMRRWADEVSSQGRQLALILPTQQKMETDLQTIAVQHQTTRLAIESELQALVVRNQTATDERALLLARTEELLSNFNTLAEASTLVRHDLAAFQDRLRLTSELKNDVDDIQRRLLLTDGLQHQLALLDQRTHDMDQLRSETRLTHTLVSTTQELNSEVQAYRSRFETVDDEIRRLALLARQTPTLETVQDLNSRLFSVERNVKIFERSAGEIDEIRLKIHNDCLRFENSLQTETDNRRREFDDLQTSFQISVLPLKTQGPPLPLLLTTLFSLNACPVSKTVAPRWTNSSDN